MVRMVCRVRVRIGRGGRTCETVALVNSGFESDEPDVAIPVRVAERLGLWPPGPAPTVTLETGGGRVVGRTSGTSRSSRRWRTGSRGGSG